MRSIARRGGEGRVGRGEAATVYTTYKMDPFRVDFLHALAALRYAAALCRYRETAAISII